MQYMATQLKTCGNPTSPTDVKEFKDISVPYEALKRRKGHISAMVIARYDHWSFFEMRQNMCLLDR